MAVYILESRDTAIELVPPERPASATLSIRSPDNAELSTPTVAVDTAAATVTAVTTNTEFAATVTAGSFVPGRQYLLVSVDTGGNASLVRCASLNAGSFRLEAPPAMAAVQVGDLLVGVRLTATVPGITPRALYHRAEWTIAGADGVTRVYQQALHVCRTLFRPPVLADECARYMSESFPDVAYNRPYGYFAERARRASARIEKELLLSERYQDRVGDFDVFTDAGTIALELELAEGGMIPPGEELNGYKARKREELGNAVTAALAGCWYDETDDGVVDEDTEVDGFMSYDMERR